MPDFIIIGAQKSGTTSLFSYLSQHPQLSPSYCKGVHFFDGGLDPSIDNFEKGTDWYRGHFRRRRDPSDKMFEASPLYIFNPLVPKRICDLLPRVKMIALLRNPTERAISQYFHELRGQNRETLSILEALQREERRLKAVLETQDYKSDSFIHHSYKSRGLYQVQLRRYLDVFPREQLLVLCSEEFFAQPEATLRGVFEFVGVDSSFKVRDLRPRQVNPYKDEVPPQVYDYLNGYFLSPNRALCELMNRRYPW